MTLCKIPAKNQIPKIREDDGSYLMPTTILQNLNMKCMPGNGIHVTLPKLDGKIRKMTQGELILGGFQPFGTTVCGLGTAAKVFDYNTQALQ